LEGSRLLGICRSWQPRVEVRYPRGS
jgi:hypothetical protein